MPSADVLPFPQARRRAFVQRAAVRIAEAEKHTTAEKLIVHTINVQSETMLRRGIAREIVEREARSLEAALRAALWHQLLGGDRA